MLSRLPREDRRRLVDALDRYVKSKKNDTEEDESAEISRTQLRMLFTFTTIPFIGFGFLDNFVMIIAGEYMDVTLGAWVGLSTMAAAGLGNILSDLAGLGLAHYIEIWAERLGFGIPKLSTAQMASKSAHFAANLGRAFGLTVGCLLGMFPLFFFDESKKLEKKQKSAKSEEEA